MRSLTSILLFFVFQQANAQRLPVGVNRIELYKKAADSLLFEHTGISKLIINKMTAPGIIRAFDNTNKAKVNQGLVVTTEYQFLSVANKNYQYALGHKFYILQYDNEDNAIKAFKVLITEGTQQQGAPGLTYTNDFVFRKAHLIYWVNTACMYSFENHMKLVNTLKNIFEVQNPGLLCECGGYCHEEQ